MTDILIAENKNVTFRNLLSRRLESGSAESMDKSIRMFNSYVKREGLETHGPTIIRTSTMFVGNENVLEMDMMVQLRGKMENVQDPYSFSEMVRLEGYLMARYRGPMNMTDMANMKIRVYAFEKEMDLGPNTYTVYTSDSKGPVVDIFQQVL